MQVFWPYTQCQCSICSYSKSIDYHGQCSTVLEIIQCHCNLFIGTECSTFRQIRVWWYVESLIWYKMKKWIFLQSETFLPKLFRCYYRYENIPTISLFSSLIFIACTYFHSAHYFPSVHLILYILCTLHPTPAFLREGGVVEGGWAYYQIFKRGSLAGPQFLEWLTLRENYLKMGSGQSEVWRFRREGRGGIIVTTLDTVK